MMIVSYLSLRKVKEMTGLEAWAIIAKCFAQLRDYRRAENPGDKGYTDEELKAEVMAFRGLKELDEREVKND